MLVVAIKISYGKFSCAQLQTKSPNLSRQKAQSRDFRVGHSSDKIHHSSLLFLNQYPQILPAFRSSQEFAKSNDHSRSRAVEPRLHPKESRFLPIPSFPLFKIISISLAEIGAYPLVIDLSLTPSPHPHCISFAFSPPTSFTNCSLFRIAA